jgi:hypothetical protein
VNQTSQIINSPGVLIWWALLSLVAFCNVICWARNFKLFKTRKAKLEERDARAQFYQLALSAGYVFGCAFRSFVPRADVQRICLLDSWVSCVALGRLVATIAELCFVAQWSLMLYQMASEAKVNWAASLARIFVPLIAIAEVFSWYATLTTNYLGNSIEESIWALTSVILIICLVGLRPHFIKRAQFFMDFALVCAVGYFLFMSLVDVPMYLSRWGANQVAGAHYLSLTDGIYDVSHRWVVTRSWEDWKTEMPWMTLYFSVAVWLSILLIRLPQLSQALIQPRSHA